VNPEAALLAAARRGGQHHLARHAVTGVSRLLVVIGGFHLSGLAFEPVIKPTVAVLTGLAPELIVLGHCTGWRSTPCQQPLT
jgi:7,8-dihydropterin-6-yl-methyl-4-(beta-D-ribofuranosyl)aminobenzene 5'-phosphate synthase